MTAVTPVLKTTTAKWSELLPKLSARLGFDVSQRMATVTFPDDTGLINAVKTAIVAELSLPGPIHSLEWSASGLLTVSYWEQVEPTPDALTEPERKAVAWALELMGACGGADALRGMVARFSLIEAEAAAMKEALRLFVTPQVESDLRRSAVLDDACEWILDTATVGDMRKALAALSTTTGQALLDRIKALEEENANLRTALTPFATWADTAEWYLSNRADTARVVTAYAKEGGLYVINVGNLRSARTALKEAEHCG